MDDPLDLRWGILGTASIAPRVIAAIRSAQAGRVEAVAGRNPSRTRAWAAEQGIPGAFDSCDELLSSGVVDAVYIPLPNRMHAEWTLAALDRSLPVLCEKPLAMDANEARCIAEASTRAGVPVAEAFMYRYHPVYDAILAAIREGRIGRVTSVRSRFTFPLDDEGSIVASADLGGGALRDVGCYCVNLARLVLGAEPDRVSGFERRDGVDRTFCGMLRFPGGTIAYFECGIESEEWQDAEVLGTAGAISLESAWFPGEQQSGYVLRCSGREEFVPAPGADTYALEVRDFAESCLGRHPTRWPIEDAVANQIVLDALFASARTGSRSIQQVSDEVQELLIRHIRANTAEEDEQREADRDARVKAVIRKLAAEGKCMPPKG